MISKKFAGVAAIVLIIYLLPVKGFSQFRVVGYVASLGQPNFKFSDTVLQKLTHLNIAFVNPDSLGNLIFPQGFDSLIVQAQHNKVKVLMAFGGGTLNPYYATLLRDANRKDFVEKLVTLMNDRHLDGIDVDLEGDAIDRHYDGLITDLSVALKPTGKLLTAAFATWNAQLISTGALKKFDFINIMSYDQTGPWRPQEPGPHSTYAKAAEDLHYWTSTRGFSKKKINLGLPFYGYCFGTKYGESMSYGDIVTKFPDADQQDMVVPDSGGIIHYNGLPTIQNKTRMALNKAGGIMIWQILQDAKGDKSLLNAIDQIVIKPAEKK